MWLWKGIIGSVVASFVNVMVIRTQKKQNYVFSRSCCPECNHVLSFVEMIPLAGFIIRKGKCHYCGCHISFRYPLVEMIGIILGILSNTVWEFVMFMDLLAIALYDHDTMEIRDSYLLVLLICGLPVMDFRYLNDHMLGSVIVSLPMLMIALSVKGFGLGDVKLMAAAGFILGRERCILGFVVRCLRGSVISLYRLASHEAQLKDQIPFGPYLVLGIMIGYAYGFRLIDFYELLCS